MSRQIVRGEILDFTGDPAAEGEEAVRYYADGILVCMDGKIEQVGAAAELLGSLAAHETIEHYPHHLIVPGFIDTHLHYPQTEMIAAYGEQLLGWLNTYTFPTEKQFSDVAHAATVAEFFLGQLLANGTTTAMVFATVHPESVEAFFTAAQKKQLRMITGKVLMDRNCPDDLQDTAEQGYRESKALIERWHGVDRLQYALTPRFAPTSTPAQLATCRQLLKQYPSVYLQTHLSENLDECAWVADLYPGACHYLDIYDKAGLLGRRTVLAHGIHLSADEWQVLAQRQAAIAHCPSSNLFMGSGLFDLATCEAQGVHLGLGTDIGAGTGFSLLQTYADAYKVQQLKGNKLSALKGLYLSTLGGARALDLAHCIGNFDTGKEADFVVLDYQATDLLAFRLKGVTDLHEKLFALMMLADDRAVAATYILGQKTYTQP